MYVDRNAWIYLQCSDDISKHVIRHIQFGSVPKPIRIYRVHIQMQWFAHHIQQHIETHTRHSTVSMMRCMKFSQCVRLVGWAADETEQQNDFQKADDDVKTKHTHARLFVGVFVYRFRCLCACVRACLCVLICINIYTLLLLLKTERKRVSNFFPS